jgi:hypothetical protein
MIDDNINSNNDYGHHHHPSLTPNASGRVLGSVLGSDSDDNDPLPHIKCKLEEDIFWFVGNDDDDDSPPSCVTCMSWSFGSRQQCC